MLVLALDCAVGTCGVGLWNDALRVAEQSETMSRGMDARLPLLAQEVLHGQPVPDLIAVTVGPGSFTGIRAGLAFAHGLASAWNRPLVGVTVVEALLHAILPTDRPVWVALRSRPGRVFLGNSLHTGSYALDPLPELGCQPFLAGNAAADVALLCGGEGSAQISSGQTTPSLAAVATIGLKRWNGCLSPLPAQPLYIDAPAAKHPEIR